MSLNLHPDDRPRVTKDEILKVVRDLVEVVETDTFCMPLGEFLAMRSRALLHAEILIDDLEG